MSGLFERSRQALRLLSRHRRFSALAMLSLAVGIALNTTMYGVLDTMIAPKLLIPEHERLYTVQFYGNFRRKVPPVEIDRMLRDGFTFAEGITGARWTWDDRIIEGGGQVREVSVVTILPNYFRVLGVRASAGRLINEADLNLETRPVVLSEQVWKELFPDAKRFEPAVVVVGGEPRMMVGLLPYQADLPGSATGVWQLPANADVSTVGISLVRLRPGVTAEQVGAVLETLRLRIAERTGEWKPGDSGWRFWRATQRPFRVYGFHYAMIGSVVAVLLIACANLANLQLARGVSRARELATRAAVGASRADIVVQLVVESAWLALGGLVLGAVFTVWSMKLVDAYVPKQLFEYITHPQVSWRVVLFAVAATSFSLVLVGLAPALKLSRVNINDVLKAGAGTGATVSTRRQYGTLVAVEVALAIAVLCSAALLLRAAYTVFSFDSGVEGRGMVSTRIAVAPDGPADHRTREDWSRLLIERARSVPSVTSAAVVTIVGPKTRAIAADDDGRTFNNYDVKTWGYRVVTPGFLVAQGLRIVKGRDFLVGESGEPSVIIDRGTATWLWPGKEPVGRLIKLDSAHTRSPWLRVVGVVDNSVGWFSVNEDVKVWATRPRLGAVYVLQVNDTTPIPQPASNRRYTATFQLLARGPGDPLRLATELRRALGALGPRTFVSFPATWEQQTGMDRLRAKHSFMGSLFLVFGLMATALAALGVYAIIAHMVAQRTREFGVRIAIGAAVSDIRQLVVREGNVLTLLGIAVGLLFTWYSAQFVRAFVFSDEDRYDSRVFAVVSLVLFGVAWLASYVPARRAMRINPVEALRND